MKKMKINIPVEKIGEVLENFINEGQSKGNVPLIFIRDKNLYHCSFSGGAIFVDKRDFDHIVHSNFLDCQCIVLGHPYKSPCFFDEEDVDLLFTRINCNNHATAKLGDLIIHYEYEYEVDLFIERLEDFYLSYYFD